MKAERVQFWQRVADAGRSLAERIYGLAERAVAIGGAIRSLLDNRGRGDRS